MPSGLAAAHDRPVGRVKVSFNANGASIYNEFCHVTINGIKADRINAPGVRSSWHTRKWIAKFESGSDHPWQGLKEVDRWLKFRHTDVGKHLVPIVAAGPLEEQNLFYVVQPFLPLEIGKRIQGTTDDAKLLQRIASELGMFDLYWTSFSKNWGYLKGVPMVFDYGV